jgi:hypothetical protein
MSHPQLSLNDVWQLFSETDRRIQAMSQETDRKFQETDRKFQEISREIREISEKTDLKIKKVSTDLGKLGNRLGDYIEEMLRPAAVQLFQQRGINVHEVHQNIEAQRVNARGIEEGIKIDLLVVNSTDVIVIECKSNFGLAEVNEHLARLEKVKRLLPTYADKKVMGAISGMVLPDQVARYAYKKGLFVITQTGEQLIIRNDAKFKANIW